MIKGIGEVSEIITSADLKEHICLECGEVFSTEHENYFRCPRCQRLHLIEVREQFDRIDEWRAQHPKTTERDDRKNDKIDPSKDVQHFKEDLYFFNWLEGHQQKCDVCGVWSVMVASVRNAPPRYYQQTDIIRLCERCWHQLTEPEDAARFLTGKEYGC